MTSRRRQREGVLLWVMFGLIGGALPSRCWAQPPSSAETFAGAETCAGCHAAEYEEWRNSKHAGAFSSTFSAYWSQTGQPSQCLQCHTTGFDPARQTFAFKGVSCEACHGALKPDHPEQPSMILPVDVSVCQRCHEQTYREWQLSRHAARDIRCFDCHAVHRQGLRQPAVENQCGACHAQRLEDFAHATHHLQGLTCATCHMPHRRTTGIGGTGAPAHSFFVGAETCAACHEETVHRSHKIPSLTDEVTRLEQTTEAQQVERLQVRARELESALELQRHEWFKRSMLALLTGLCLGIALHWLWHRTNNHPKPPASLR